MTVMRWFFLLIFISIFFIFTNTFASQEIKILKMSIATTINPTTKDFIKEGIKKAKRIDAKAIIIELDTPGGLETSMRSIVKDILSIDIPIIVYVSPKGARAGSAGVFITLAAHIAAMAPGTNIGSAHPVSIGGGEKDAVMTKKVAEDAKAFIRSIAEMRNRNIKLAEDAVEKSISLTEKEALENKLIDLIAEDQSELLRKIDGKVVKTSKGDITINTKNAEIIEFEMSFRHKILDIIANPTIAYILMILGIYALIYEFSNPGGYVSGVIGIILLTLGLYALQILEANFAGLIMVIIGVTLIILEAFILSYGLLAFGGIISLTIGFIMLFDIKELNLMDMLLKLLPILVLLTALFLYALKTLKKIMKIKNTLGSEGLVGEEGVAKSPINEKGGWLLIKGELWSAYSNDQIAEGEEAVVEAYKGLKLKVRKKN